MQRVDRVRDILNKQNFDACLISSPSNIAYILNYFGFSRAERDAFLLVGKRNVYLFTSPLYSNAFSKTKDFNLLITDADNRFSKLLENTVKKEKITRLGIEEENISVKEYKSIEKCGAKLHPVDLTSLREIKNGDEIEKIKKACQISDTALKKIGDFIKPGISELKLSKLLESEIRNLGADIAFETIVAFGPNSATPHHKTGDQVLKSQDVVLIDFGAKFGNYCADITRTFFVGNPTAEQEKAYDAVLEAQNKAVENLRSLIINHKSNPKSPLARSVDETARKYILSQGYPSIPHSLGHGIGLEVHEAPSLSPLSDEELTEGMVFSIEPGIYFPGKFGIRIEDLFAIQGNELKKLTQYSS